jgi:L,D-peptidoglycan transpeptidase YkuD (ErfK/YbiS/YcfS/YnhG family)
MTKLSSLCSSIVCGLVLMGIGAPAADAQDPKDKPLRSSLQMIVVTVPDWSTVDGRLQRYERGQPGGQWKRVGEPVSIVVGKNGMGWGAGLVATDAAGTRDPADPVKKEGDGKSPAGAFRISSAFGYADAAPKGWKMSYIRLTPTVECVDDTASHFYNRIVDRATVTPDWNSSEKMASAGTAYIWGAVIDHDANPPVPGVGSCVFMHIWAGAGHGTAGCTAMPQERLEPILAWLDPAKSPILVQMPVASYKRLEKAWRLPRLPGE